MVSFGILFIFSVVLQPASCRRRPRERCAPCLPKVKCPLPLPVTTHPIDIINIYKIFYCPRSTSKSPDSRHQCTTLFPTCCYPKTPLSFLYRCCLLRLDRSLDVFQDFTTNNHGHAVQIRQQQPRRPGAEDRQHVNSRRIREQPRVSIIFRNNISTNAKTINSNNQP